MNPPLDASVSVATYRFLALAWALLAIASCSQDPEPGRASARIVSLSPLGTRAVLAMGLGESLIAVDPGSRNLLDSARPTAEGAPAEGLHSTLTLLPARSEMDADVREAWIRASERIVTVDPHDFDEAFALYDEIGSAIHREDLARSVRLHLGDALGLYGLRHAAAIRPCVAVIVSLDPLVLAGGHSFESNLLELLGAESATHDDGEEWRLTATLADLEALEPNLVVVLDTPTLGPNALDALARQLVPAAVERLAFEAWPLWLGDPERRRTILDDWTAAIDRARGIERDGANCSRTAGGMASPIRRSEPARRDPGSARRTETPSP